MGAPLSMTTTSYNRSRLGTRVVGTAKRALVDHPDEHVDGRRVRRAEERQRFRRSRRLAHARLERGPGPQMLNARGGEVFLRLPA